MSHFPTVPRRTRLCLTILMLWWVSPGGSSFAQLVTPGDLIDTPRRPVATYSIVARDAQTGQMGVAVQSHWLIGRAHV